MKAKIDVKSWFKKLLVSYKNNKSLRVISIIVLVVLVAGGFLLSKQLSKSTGTKAERITATVGRGNIANVIEGTGTVEAISQYEITSLAKGDVIADYFSEGDYVVKDQLLYEIDSASVDKSITKQKSNVEKAQMNYNETLEDISNLNIKTGIKGVISNIYVEVGDSVSNGTKIADIVDKDTLVVLLPFGKFDAQNISSGSGAEVILSRSLTSLQGKVTKVATGTYVNSYGVEVTDVEIQFDNPGSVAEGETVTATVGDYACYDSGAVSYIESRTITAKASGEVQSIIKGKGDYVRSGDVIAVLDSSTADKSRRDAQMALQDAGLSLDDLYDDLDDYSIRSPIDGKVIQKNIKAGEKLDSNSSAAMAIIADLSKLTFDISIDELDISKISVGQEVTITADALPNRNFIGTVSNISIVGSAYQGVTSYPVTVTIDNTEESGLIPGMNVEAQIIVDSVENVLRIPVSAVHMGDLVIVKDDGSFADPLDIDLNAYIKSGDKAGEEAAGTQNSSNDGSPNRYDSVQTPRTGSAQVPGSERPQMQSGERPQMQSGERPQKQSGEYPQRQSGETENVPSTDKLQDTYPQMGEDGNAPVRNAAPIHSENAKTQNIDIQASAGNTPTEETKKPNDSDAKENSAPRQDDDMQSKVNERLKAMIDNLDVPAGYTVVRVKTGLTDGTYVEILEIEGSLKEGDTILLPVISNTASEAAFQGGMPGRMGGMPGGMGGMSGMPRGMGGAMTGGGNMNRGAMGVNRQQGR